MSKFADACVASYKDWEAELPGIDNLQEPEYSEKHIKRMNKLFDKMRENEYHHFTKKAVRIILVAAAISALLLYAFTIPSSREVFRDTFDDFSKFSFEKHNCNSVLEIDVGYMPEAYKLSEVKDDIKLIEYIFESPEGAILICKRPSSTTIMFDADNSYSEEFVVDNTTYTIVINYDGINYVIFTKNDYSYVVEGRISKEELLKIAQNLE